MLMKKDIYSRFSRNHYKTDPRCFLKLSSEWEQKDLVPEISRRYSNPLNANKHYAEHYNPAVVMKNIELGNSDKGFLFYVSKLRGDKLVSVWNSNCNPDS